MSASSSKPDLHFIAATWLETFAAALASRSPGAVAATFVPNGWLRDSLTFTWDDRTLEGREKISQFLSPVLTDTSVQNVRLLDDVYFAPKLGEIGIEFGYTYETETKKGQGVVHLVLAEKGGDGARPQNERGRAQKGGQWQAFIVSMIVRDLKGYERRLGGGVLRTSSTPALLVRKDSIRPGAVTRRC